MKMSANDSNSANECWQYKTLDTNNTYFPPHKRRSTYEKDAHAMERIGVNSFCRKSVLSLREKSLIHQIEVAVVVDECVLQVLSM